MNAFEAVTSSGNLPIVNKKIYVNLVGSIR